MTHIISSFVDYNDYHFFSNRYCYMVQISGIENSFEAKVMADKLSNLFINTPIYEMETSCYFVYSNNFITREKVVQLFNTDKVVVRDFDRQFVRNGA